MITITKTKNEIQEGCPHRILTIDVDLEDIQSISKTMTTDEFHKHVGQKLCKNFESIMKCKS